MTFYSYVDTDGDRIEPGVMVGYREEWAKEDEPDKWCASYIVVDLPNYGHMVEMTRIEFFRPYVDGESNYTVTDPNHIVSVEPWKIGAI